MRALYGLRFLILRVKTMWAEASHGILRVQRVFRGRKMRKEN